MLTTLAFQNFPQLFLIHPLSEAYWTAAGLSTERGTQQNTLQPPEAPSYQGWGRQTINETHNKEHIFSELCCYLLWKTKGEPSKERCMEAALFLLFLNRLSFLEQLRVYGKIR